MASSSKGHRREREFLEKLTKDGFVAHRIAGSGVGENAICDLIAVKNGEIHFIEVKSRRDVFYTKPHTEQLETLKNVAISCGAKPVLAVKLNYKDWQVLDLREGLPNKIS